MSIFTKTLTPAYDMSGGAETFDIFDAAGNPIDFSKYNSVYVQVEYKDVVGANGNILFERKHKAATRYNIAPNGTHVTIITGEQVADFDHSVFGASNIQIRFVVGSVTAGTIEKIFIQAKSK